MTTAPVGIMPAQQPGSASPQIGWRGLARTGLQLRGDDWLRTTAASADIGDAQLERLQFAVVFDPFVCVRVL
jgi:hypothetical protein